MAYRTYCKQIENVITIASPTMRLIHRAEEKIMVDFAGYCPLGLGHHNMISKFALFVAILPASQYIFACVVRSQNIPDWISACEQMLRFYHGVTVSIVPDNLKAAIISRPRNAKPVVNTVFQMFCDHYETGVMPTRVRHPKDKALVEGAVKFVQRLLRLALHNRPLMNIVNLNKIVRQIIDQINRRLLRRTSGATRASQFALLDSLRFDRCHAPHLSTMT